MSWRIEHTDTLTVLRELPDRWAQSCIAYPPCGLASDRTLAVLAQVHRVLRDDGTLWLFLPNEALYPELHSAGWIEQLPPCWATPLTLRGVGIRPLALLTKRDTYFHSASSFAAQPQRASRPRRPGWPTPRVAQGRDAIRGLAGRCVLTATARVACGSCGTPYRRGEPGEQRSTCTHHNPAGRCLVLDPFYRPAHGTLQAAHQNGRSFLGIVENRAGERP
jgi:hypothetical protein